ncbi:MAG: DNA/RNA non-specific endonuclease [Rhizonema sp. NSF051]|nr:DNA/RNA non-specific endonuclease [Rhizonema sp. NSF051]
MKKTKFLTFLIPFAAACLTAVLVAFFSTPAPAQTSVHLTMGNPSNASTSSLSNYLLVKSQYATSHHCSRGIPNWVSWQLNSSWLGSAPRQDNFRADTTSPVGCYQVSSSDYTGSGFDRGHMTPSADRTDTIENNSATFLMTNILPQAPDNNQGPWADLEDYARELVGQGRELYIISGNYGSGGTGSNGGATTISSGRVTVPDRVWKSIIVLDRPGLGVSGVTTSTRVITVDLPNDQGIRNNAWRSYRVSVDTIEARTGYDLFSNVPDSIENTIEARVDNQ